MSTERTFAHVDDIQRMWLDGDMLHTLFRDGQRDCVRYDQTTYIGDDVRAALETAGVYEPKAWNGEQATVEDVWEILFNDGEVYATREGCTAEEAVAGIIKDVEFLQGEKRAMGKEPFDIRLLGVRRRERTTKYASSTVYSDYRPMSEFEQS